jgi:S-phase kinase-associated protein 1
MSQQIKLQSNEGDIFTVDLKTAKMSNTVKTMLEDLGFDDSKKDETVPLPRVSSDILKLIIDWSTHHKDEKVYENNNDDYKERRIDDIPKWDVDFLKVDQSTLFEIILAASYLDINDLLEVGCQTVANMMKGKTPEEIRKIFNIENDLTPEEEDEIRKENEWCEEK